MFRKKEEYVYMDLKLTMSAKQLSDALYAGIQTKAEFTTLYDLYAGEFTRKQNSRNTAYIKVHIHPDEIKFFEEISNLKLIKPEGLTLNYKQCLKQNRTAHTNNVYKNLK